MKQTVEMEEDEWKATLGCLAQAPWSIANPLIMKMGAQLQAQSKQQTNNSGETAAAQGDLPSSRAN